MRLTAPDSDHYTTHAVHRTILCGLLLAILATGPVQSAAQTASRAVDWKTIRPGLERTDVSIYRATPAGDSTLVLFRLNPLQWTPRVLTRTEAKDREHGLTVREWAEQTGLPVVTNAGMFAKDGSTHVGYLRTATGHVNSPDVNKYQSVAAFSPKREDLPPFRILDLDCTSIDTVKARYHGVMQNLRLIKRPGENRWSRQNKRWSEMALAEDDEGNIILAFSRSPYPMHTFNEILLDLPIGIVAAQHLEGGPEASLFIQVETKPNVWMGSWETGFYEMDDNEELWPIPNALGFAPADAD